MPLHEIDSDNLRSHCKRTIENLERWLRRLIDDELSKASKDYLNLEKNGSPIFKAEIRHYLPAEAAKNPTRFPRPIDAATLEEEIAIITNPMIYNDYFKAAMNGAFPDGREECRTFLSRLIEPRNHLYHANPISVRQAEQVVCYSNDVIASLKEYYVAQNLAQEFNAPTIVEYRDSLGRVFNGRNIIRTGSLPGAVIMVWKSPTSMPEEPERPKLRPGDSVALEVVVDPSFDPSGYVVEWTCKGRFWGTGARITRVIQPEDIGMHVTVLCTVTSTNAWHRHGHYDDSLTVTLTVLPAP